jgi:circadian clock protein KaiC
LATEFVVRGALQFGESGVLMTFDERPEDITTNVASLGFNLQSLIASKRLAIDHVAVDRNELEENGEYDLEGLFIRLDYAIRSIRAKRVVLDTLESLFSGFSNEAILRAELRRLFLWLKERGLTTVLTGEKGDRQFTRHGLEEYVSDCVILLDHRVTEQVSTRRLRIVKYRGSTHGTNEYPFLIDEQGISVLPITEAHLDYKVSEERIPTGIASLDDMLGGKGLFRGGTVLLSGTAGAGKTSVAAHFANAVCERGERCLYFSFEESPQQMLRNMRSIGLNLQPHVRSGRLQFMATQSTAEGLEMHLVRILRVIDRFQPAAIVVDPISSLENSGERSSALDLLVRLVDVLRSRGITAFLVSLVPGVDSRSWTQSGISSAVDTWIRIRNIEAGNEQNRTLHVLKSRGMAHSNQIRRLVISDSGIQLLSALPAGNGMVIETPSWQHGAGVSAGQGTARREAERRLRILEHRGKALEAEIAALREENAAYGTDDFCPVVSQRKSDPSRPEARRRSRARNRLPVKGTRIRTRS